MTTSFTGFGSTAGFTGAGAGSGGGANTQFPTYAAAKAASIPAATNFVTTMGYYTPGDGGGDLYQRTLTALSQFDPGFVSTHDGSIWSRVPQTPVHVKQWGWVGDGVTDNAVALFQITAYMRVVAPVSRIFHNVSISIGNPCIVQPSNNAPPYDYHELHSDQMVMFSTTGTLPTGIVAGQIYNTQYLGVTPETFQISATTGIYAGRLNLPFSYTPGYDYNSLYAKGSPVVTTGSQSGTHTMEVLGGVGPWAEIIIDPGVYVALVGSALSLGLCSGLQRVRISGYGATLLSVAASSWMFQSTWFLDGNYVDGNGAHLYAPQSAFATTSMPDLLPIQTITLITAADAAKFRINSWVKLEALETQGNDGYPNAFYLEFQKIRSIDYVLGKISFWGFLQNGYRSTYPAILNPAQAGILFGPATISSMPDMWDTEVEVRGVSLLNDVGQLECVYGGVRSVRLVDCTVSSPSGTFLGGPFPAVVQRWTLENCRWINTTVEVDKLIDIVVVKDCDFDTNSYLRIQSSAPNQLIIENCQMRGGMLGTSRSVSIKDSYIGPGVLGGGFGLAIGPVFGVTERITLENCFISRLTFALQQSSGQTISDFSSVTNGVLVVNQGKTNHLGQTWGGPGSASNIPLFAGVPGARFICCSSPQMFDPGGTIQAGQGLESMGCPFTVFDVYTGAPGTYTGTSFCVATSLSSTPTSTYTFTASISGTTMTVTGGLPAADSVLVANAYYITGDANIPAGTFITSGPGWLGGVATGAYTLNNNCGTVGSKTLTATIRDIALTPICPRVTIINCTGCQTVSDMSGGPSDIPLLSFFKRSYDGFQNLGSYQASTNLMGNLLSWEINVTKAYTGAAGTMNLTVSMFGFRNTANNMVPTFLSQVVNLKTAGKRTITATGTTGSVTGDSIAACNYWLSGAHYVTWTAAAGGDTSDQMAEFTMTAQSDQGTGGATISVGTAPFGGDVINDTSVGAIILS